MSLGTPFGVPLRLSGSWFIGAAIITWIFAPVAERWLVLEPPWQWVVAASFAVLLGLSVLAHELAHAVAAQRFGLKVKSMTIHLLGGVTMMEAETRRPWVDFVIAAVGPVTSLVLGVVAWGAHLTTPDGTVLAFVTWQLAVSNIIVGVFNLVPALPLDGGRLLRDVVWAVSGREHIGTLVSGWTGRGFAVIVAVLALLPTLLGNPDVVWLLWGMLLAGFIWIEAGRSLATARASKKLAALSAATLMRPAVTFRHDTPLSIALAQRADERLAILVADSNGDITGFVSADAAAAVPVDRQPWVPVSSVAVSIVSETAIDPSAAGLALVDAMNEHPSPGHLVVDAHGTVYGVLVTADVQTALMQ